MKQRRWKTGQRVPRGLSLLELVVAMAIGSVLLSAIWSMFNVIALRQEREILKAEETQLVRSLHQILSRDLARVIPQSAVAPPGGQNSAMPLPLFAPNSMAAPTGILWSPGPDASLSGTANRLELICYSDSSAEPARNPQGDKLAGDSSDDDLNSLPATRSVVYCWEGTHRMPSLRSPDLKDRSEGEKDSAPGPGLTRIETGVAGGDSGREPGTEETVCEFHRVILQYFDGKSWQSSWDSAASGRLPVAIRVQFGLKMEIVAEDETDSAEEETTWEEDAFDYEMADNPVVESDPGVRWRSFVLLVAPSPPVESAAPSVVDRYQPDQNPSRRSHTGIGVDLP